MGRLSGEHLHASGCAWRAPSARASATITDLRDRVGDLREDRDAWREQGQRKRLTWRGLFGGGKAE